MATTLLRSSALRATLRGPSATKALIKPLSISATGKATLPDLPYDYAALEPYISSKIMTLHHKNHHATYVNSFNTFSSQLSSAPDFATANSLLPLINFHSGGHINHSLFWENLAPKASGGGAPPSGRLATTIDETFGSYDKFKAQFNKALAGIQGSGWAWLVQDKETGLLSIKTYQNQDPVVGQYRPVLGIDAWEHAYYLDYQNRKAEYFEKVWEVVNWGKAAERLE